MKSRLACVISTLLICLALISCSGTEDSVDTDIPSVYLREGSIDSDLLLTYYVEVDEPMEHDLLVLLETKTFSSTEIMAPTLMDADKFVAIIPQGSTRTGDFYLQLKELKPDEPVVDEPVVDEPVVDEPVVDEPEVEQAFMITVRHDYERYKLSEHGEFITRYTHYHIQGNVDTPNHLDEGMRREIPTNHRYHSYSNGDIFSEYPQTDEMANNPWQYRIIFHGTTKPYAE